MSAEAVSPEKTATIYALTDPDSGEVRYVGQTKDVWKRYASHLLMVKGSAAKHGWFLDLQSRQQFPVLKILEEQVDPSNAKARERWWIAYYHGQGDKLANAFLIPKPPKIRQEPRKTLRSSAQTPHPLYLWRDQHGLSQDELAVRGGAGHDLPH